MQQRIQFNEKEAEANLAKVYMSIYENKSLQEAINETLEEKIRSKEVELKEVRAQI